MRMHYDADDFIKQFNIASRVVAENRPWYANLYLKFRGQIHPAVYDAMRITRPYDWHQLVLEFPHRSESDPYRIAYTRDERAGLDDRQTVTTVGKYLMRHFSLRDNIIRDIAALYSTPSTFKILDKVEEFVHAVNNGPNSCMCWREGRGVRCRDGVERHPYHAYDPKYGWRMAVRIDGGRIDGRALLVLDDEEMREDDYLGYFVRSFKRDSGGGYSYSDEQLEAWLHKQGYRKRSAYHEGVLLAYHETSDEFLAPYIDGDLRRVEVDTYNGSKVLRLDEHGEYECDNTDGTPAGGSRCTCDECGDSCDEDDMTWAGPVDEEYICQYCADNHYTWAYSRRGNQRLIRNNNVVWVDSQDAHYDEDYLDDNNIVCLHNGEYEHTDNVVYINSQDAYYHMEDDDIVEDHAGEWQLRSDCVQLGNGEWALDEEAFWCAGTACYYLLDDVTPVDVDGEQYHPDHAPETEETETNESETGE